ncbi:uncharacterized protein [Hoplias malabaricus]|uniref:uncharacterized protein n=1 Tax=Hoplias malabaricus TaxID=27720 RepID=UPI003462C218
MASSVLNIISSITILLWLSLATNGNTQDIELDCIPSIKVSRNTVWKSPELKTLMINCTVIVTPHCWRNLSFSWCKISDGNNCRPLIYSNHTSTKWRNINEEERILFLIFWSLSVEDAGLYRCEILKPVYATGHAINVTVTASDEVFDFESNENKTINSSSARNTSNDLEMEWMWPYVYICSGIVGLVLVVLTVALLIIHCQGAKRSTKKKIAENQAQCTQSNASENPHFKAWVPDASPCGNTNSLPLQIHPPSPGIYGNTPVRGSSQRDGPSRRHPANHRPQPGQRHERVPVNEEENLLVYASLNHKATSQGPVRSCHPDETSEYAAIRVT